MELRPVFNALMRNKAGLLLIALQVAITLAIVCNSVFIILQRIDKIGRPSGMDEAGIFTVSSLGFAPNFDMAGSIRQDLDTLRGMPGIIDATTINAIPLSNGGWSSTLAEKPQDAAGPPRNNQQSAIYLVDEHGLAALGSKLVEGRNFNTTDITATTPDDNGDARSIIITKALADKLFPGGALGKLVYGAPTKGEDQPATVIGIVERLHAPWVGADMVEQSTLVPLVQHGDGGTRYLIRTQAGERDRLMSEVERKLGEINPGRIVREVKSMDEFRANSYRQDRAMAIILATVIIALLTVTGLAIVGMASFWVTRRTKQIGTRRALGARRVDIRRYFMLENVIVVGIGAVMGLLFTYGFNIWLMKHYELPRLDWYYAPLGALVVLVLGQLAVFGPATRATRVSPAVATRTV